MSEGVLCYRADDCHNSGNKIHGIPDWCTSPKADPSVGGCFAHKGEPPADCQDCTRALDWDGSGRGGCAEYKALNRDDHPYNRGFCHSYRPGRKGYENPVQCTHCGTVYPNDKYFHRCSDGDVLCCKHFGHEPGSCMEDKI